MVFMADIGPDHKFTKPKREVLSPDDLVKWPVSEAYNEYIEFIMKLNTAVMGKKLSHAVTQSQNLTALLGVLSKLSEWIDDIPPIDQPQRFGNKAFKTWFAMLTDNVLGLLQSALEEKHHAALEEITPYLTDSFGNSTRIDYGSGHEMNFVLFMYCLFRAKILDWSNAQDQIGAVLKLFDSYINLARKLQLVYRMEPAGSHGAWSLDDYQFVPFIWGSSQLIRNAQIEPSHMTDPSRVGESKSEFMFFGCIDYILQVKTGPFHEHSSQLWNISGVESWTKVNTGLIKMYKAEIISKYPVIQHTLFGSLLSINQSQAGQGALGALRGPLGARPQPPLFTQPDQPAQVLAQSRAEDTNDPK